jgi:two-component system OmpR family response regulator/two-component system response regulator QseB
MRVLVVEDDPLLGDALQAGLRQARFACDWVRDGQAADLAWRSNDYAAVVLDLGLPKMDGLALLRRRRDAGDRSPVLILTARDAVGDRVAGLDAGADDYVVKPVDLDELAARLRALVRRAGGEASPRLRVGEVELDPAARTVSFRGHSVDCKAKEFDVLAELMRNAGRVLSRDQLAERIYGWGEEIESNVIEVHIHHLRRKLSPEVISTVRGVGYLMSRESG